MSFDIAVLLALVKHPGVTTVTEESLPTATPLLTRQRKRSSGHLRFRAGRDELTWRCVCTTPRLTS